MIAACVFTGIPMPVIVLFSIIVGCFALYGNYVMIVRNNDADYILKHADKGTYFDKEINVLLKQRQSLRGRSGVISADEKLMEVFQLANRKIEGNIASAVKFMQMYDYVAQSDRGYLDGLISENEKILNDFNEVVMQFVKLDNSVNDVDASYIDDLLITLKEMENHE